MTVIEQITKLCDERKVEMEYTLVTNMGICEFRFRKNPYHLNYQISINDFVHLPEGTVLQNINNQLDKICGVVPTVGNGQTSDGHHTFDELYYHRMILFATICHDHLNKSWKSLMHNDGTMYEGYFIVGIETPMGQFTYHYAEQYWNLFDVREIQRAPKWDGHTSADVVRLLSLQGTTDKKKDLSYERSPLWLAQRIQEGETWENIKSEGDVQKITMLDGKLYFKKADISCSDILVVDLNDTFRLQIKEGESDE